MKTGPTAFIPYQSILLAAFCLFITNELTASKANNCIPCENLKELQLPDVTILKAELLQNDTTGGQKITVPFCHVLGRISKEIHFELLLPQQWNGRFLMSGGGGFVGSIQNFLRDRTNEGYASAGTDTGHQGNGLLADWALNNMERQINFGRLAIHWTAVVSKSILNSYFCKGPDFAYFLGCSRGGGQAMIEAQLYPNDFDGIVAGAPAIKWPAIGAKFVHVSQKNYPDPEKLDRPVLTNENLSLLEKLVLKQCDILDGLEDQIINDPRECLLDTSALPLCPAGEEGENCFTREQVAVIKAVYEDLMVGEELIYPRFPPGLERRSGSWDTWISGTNPNLQNSPSLHFMFGTNIFKYFIFNDPDWDYTKYKFNDFFEESRYASAFLDASEVDYSGFKKKNGKMIFYHGWNDPALSAYATIQHYEEALQNDPDLEDYLRLFLLPGVLHCGGGTGPDKLDWVRLIQDWVENGNAPERIVLTKEENGKVIMARPVYPYPRVAVYNGKGDPKQENSFNSKP